MAYFPSRVMPKKLAEESPKDVKNSPLIYNASDYNVHHREIIAIQTMLTGKGGGLTNQKMFETTNLLPTTLVNYYYYLRSVVANKIMPIVLSGTIKAGNPIVLPEGIVFTRVVGPLDKTATTITVNSTYGFPKSGIITKFNKQSLSEYCTTGSTSTPPSVGDSCDSGYKYLDYVDFITNGLSIKTFQETILYNGKSNFEFYNCIRGYQQTTAEDLEDEEAIIVCGNAALWLSHNFWSERMTSSTVSAVTPANQFSIEVDPALFVDAVLLEKGSQQVKPDISDFSELSYVLSIKPDFTDIDSDLLINPSGGGSGGSGGPRPPVPPVVPPNLPIITTVSLPSGTRTIVYPTATNPGFQIQASQPVSFYTQQGLPSGLSMSSSGLISGTPTVVGTFTVVITADGIVSKQFSLTIVPKPEDPVVVRPPRINSSLTASGTTGSPFSYSITCDLVNGDAPTFFSTTPSVLPLGLTLNSLTGVISGTPVVATAPTTVSINIAAANAGGSDSKTLQITINPVDPGCTTTPTVTVSGKTTVYLNEAINITFNVTNFLQLSVQNRPSSIGFTQGTNPTGTLSGAFTALGTYTINVVASNNCGTRNQPIVINVITEPPVEPPGGGGGGNGGGGNGGGGGGDGDPEPPPSGGGDDLPPDYEPPELTDNFPDDDDDPDLPAKYGIGQIVVSKLQLNTTGKKATIVVNFLERANLGFKAGEEFPNPLIAFIINDKIFKIRLNVTDNKKLSNKGSGNSTGVGPWTITYKFTRPKLKKDRVSKQLPPADTRLKWTLAISIKTTSSFFITDSAAMDLSIGAVKSRFFINFVNMFLTPDGFNEASGYTLHPDEKSIRVVRSSSTKAFAVSYDRKKYVKDLQAGKAGPSEGELNRLGIGRA